MAAKKGQYFGPKGSRRVRFELSKQTYTVNEIVAFRVDTTPGGKAQEGLKMLGGALRDRMVALKQEFFRVKTCVKQSEAVIRDVRVLCESSASNFVSAVVRARSEAKAFSAAAATKVKAGGEPLKEEAEPQPAASKGEEQERDQESPLAVVPEWGPLPGDGNCLSLATRSALAEAASLFNANLRVLEHRIWRLLEERAVLDCPYRRNKLQGGRNARPLASSEERRIRQLALQAAAAAELKDKEAQKKAQKPAVVDPLLRPPPSVLRVPHCEWRAFPKLSQIKNLKNGDCQTLGLYISIQFLKRDFSAERLAAALPSEGQRSLLLRFAKIQCARNLVLRCPLIPCAELVEILGLRSRGKAGKAVFLALRKRLRSLELLLEALDQSTGEYLIALRATEAQLEAICACDAFLAKRAKTNSASSGALLAKQEGETALPSWEEVKEGLAGEATALSAASGRETPSEQGELLQVQREFAATRPPLAVPSPGRLLGNARSGQSSSFGGNPEESPSHEERSAKRRRDEEEGAVVEEELGVTRFSAPGSPSALQISLERIVLLSADAKWIFPSEVIHFLLPKSGGKSSDAGPAPTQ